MRRTSFIAFQALASYATTVETDSLGDSLLSLPPQVYSGRCCRCGRKLSYRGASRARFPSLVKRQTPAKFTLLNRCWNVWEHIWS